MDNLDAAIMANHYSGSVFDDPDLVLFDSREIIDELRQKHPRAKCIRFDLGLKDSELACLLYCHGITG